MFSPNFTGMRTLTVSDYAKEKNLSVAAVYKQIHKNQLSGASCMKVGSVYLILVNDQVNDKNAVTVKNP